MMLVSPFKPLPQKKKSPFKPKLALAKRVYTIVPIFIGLGLQAIA